MHDDEPLYFTANIRKHLINVISERWKEKWNNVPIWGHARSADLTFCDFFLGGLNNIQYL